MRDRNNGPVHQPGELGNDGLNPRLEDGELASLRADGDGVDADIAQVGLVEHVRVAMEAEQVTQDLGALCVQQVIEVSGAGRGIDPFLCRAGRGVAVVVDSSREARVDLHTREPVGGLSGEVGPHLVLAVEEDRSRVVADAVGDAIVPPGAESVTVVQAGDGGRDDTVGGELGRGREAGALEPDLVEGDLLVDVAVSGVVLLQMGEGVADVGVVVQVVLEPDEQAVRVHAGRCPGEVGRRGRPDVSAGADGLDELEGRVRRRVVLDGAAGAGALTGRRGAGLDVAVTVVADLDEVGASSVEFGADAGQPVGDAVHIIGRDAEDSPAGLVDVGLKEHVIDLGVQVHAAVPGMQAARDPGDPGVLQVVGGLGPDGVESDEEGHLLAAIEVVDDRGHRLAVNPAAGGKRRDRFGGVGVGDGSRVVPETRGRDARAGAGLEAGRGEVAGIREVDELLDAVGAAAAVANRGGAEVGTGEDVVLDHAHAVGELVRVQLVPLVVRQGGAPAIVTVVVADLAGNDDTAKVAP